MSSPDDHSRGFLNVPVDPLRYDGDYSTDPFKVQKSCEIHLT